MQEIAVELLELIAGGMVLTPEIMNDPVKYREWKNKGLLSIEP